MIRLINNEKFVKFSDLINKIRDNDYYYTFAKSLLMANDIDTSCIPNNNLVAKMFDFFIYNKELQIHRIENERIETIQVHELPSIYTSKRISVNSIEYKDSIYIKIDDLKKLYANKCIVFPNSLFRH